MHFHQLKLEGEALRIKFMLDFHAIGHIFVPAAGIIRLGENLDDEKKIR